MSRYALIYTQTVSATVWIEADSIEDAEEKCDTDEAWEALPRDVCAQCGGWGRDYSLELDGTWEFLEAQES